MARKTLPTFNSRRNEWADYVTYAIERRLSKVINQLSVITGLEEKEEIDDLFNDLSAMLHYAWAVYKTEDRTASNAQVYWNLQALKEAPVADLLKCMGLADTETLAEIYPRYPGGWRAMENGPVDIDALKGAITGALSCLEKPKPGRPTDTHYKTYRFLARELPIIYARTGNVPSRRTDWITGESYGPFRDFVSVVMSIVPQRLRKGKKGATNDVDYLVQLAVKAYSESETPA